MLHNKQVARELNWILFHVFRNLGESVFQMEICWHIFQHADVSDVFLPTVEHVQIRSNVRIPGTSKEMRCATSAFPSPPVYFHTPL